MSRTLLTVTICTGTACYVLGGSNYLLLKERLSGEVFDRIRLEGSPCMGICRETGRDRLPCLKIGETVYTGLSLEEAVETVTARVEAENEE